jgi:hypothetical protein
VSRDPSAIPRHVFRWDLDKTYLHTEFDHWLDLLKTAVETPETKRAVPGAARLIRALRLHQPSRVTILSGSPEQMRGTLESKLRLDGIVWDEFTLKPSVRNILRLRFRALRDQVGYKLPALLDARTRVPQDVPETLFGDDAEADALVYSLYADVLAGRVSDRQLTAVLEQSRTYADVVSETIRLVHRTARGDVVRRIFIHLERRSDPSFFRIYGPRVVPVSNYLQAAAVLVADGLLGADALAPIAAAVHAETQLPVPEIAESLHALVRRGDLAPDTVRRIGQSLGDGAPQPNLTADDLTDLADALQDTPPAGEPPPEVAIDYLDALADDRARWEAARDAARVRGRDRSRPPSGE